MFLVIVVIKNTLEKLYLTNVHMKQISWSVSPLSILFPRSLELTYYRTNDTSQNSLVRSCKGTKEHRSKGSNSMLSNDFRSQISRVFPFFIFIFKDITQPGASGIKFPGFSHFSGYVGTLICACEILRFSSEKKRRYFTRVYFIQWHHLTNFVENHWKCH